MVHDLILRWAVTVLFVLAIAEGLYSLVVHRMPWYGKVGHLLHVLMSAAMIAMAWPATATWPAVPGIVVFAVAAAWFVGLVVVPNPWATRAAHAYHAVMMGAMAWMYVVMDPDLLPGTTMGGGSGSGDMGSMAGMDMSGMDMGGSDSGMSMQLPGYATAINWVLALGFVGAVVVWLYLYFARRRASGDAAALLTHSGELSQVFMAAGMAVMFFVMV